jgi:guanylate kinase
MRLSDLNPCPHPLLLVLSGPSGVGKDYVLSNLKRRPVAEGLSAIITSTTRPMRPGEKQDVDYHFLSPTEFQDLIATDGLLEYANVYGNWYGVPKNPVKVALASGRDAIIKVDVQGARTIKNIAPEAVLVFLSPPSMEELTERLKQRNTESPEQLETRLKTAEAEMLEMARFDYVIINSHGRVDQVIAGVEAIISAEKLRVKPRECRL